MVCVCCEHGDDYAVQDVVCMFAVGTPPCEVNKIIFMFNRLLALTRVLQHAVIRL